MQRESSVRMGVERLAARKRSLFLAAFAVGLVAACANATGALALSPSVSTLAGSNVAETTATLNGSVNPNSLETKTYFEYGPTVAYGSKTAEVNVGSGASTIETAKAVSGLTANTTYHYRIVATNSSGTSQGTDRTFTVGWTLQSIAAGIVDVSCSSPTACTAVGGTEEQAVVQRWNGTEWKSQTPAKPAEAVKTYFTGVSCPAASSCFAVGRYTKAAGKWVTLAETWNGTEWKVQASPNNAEATQSFLENVSCSSTSECTAVGWFQVTGPPETSKALALRWNGTEWSLQTTPNPSSNHIQLTSVSCPSSTFCMATGFYPEAETGTWAPTSERWNGTEWTLKAGQKPGGSMLGWFYGVSCTSSTACIAIGFKEVNSMTHEYQPMAQGWNGSEWSLQTIPSIEGSVQARDVSCPATNSCTAVGGRVLSWDGSAWTVQGNALAGSAVSCIASRGCEAVESSHAAANWRGAAPTATTNAASSVAEKSATLNGTVNPNGTETKAFFEYGTTTSYGTKTAELNLGSGTSAVEKSAAVSGLTANTTYHYRIVANNENPETGKGEDKTFTTIGPPTVITEAGVSEESGETATLNGFVDPNGQATTYQFEYGTTSGVYTKTVPEPAESAGSEMNGKSVSYTITGLTRGTKYYFRITASNAGGKATGSEKSFVTNSAPIATTLAATALKPHSATLNGTVAPHGLATKYQFEYGTTISYGTKAPISPTELKSQSESGSESVEQPVAGLTEETVYHYRLVAENALGTSFGEDKTFTTSEEENVGKTVLCTEEKVRCPVGKTDGTGTEIKLSLLLVKAKVTTSFKNIECSKSSINAKVTSTGEKISANVETLTFEECNCEVKALKNGTLEFTHLPSSDDATVKSSGTEVTASCSTIIGNVHCIYKTEGTDLGTLEGGTTAVIGLEVNVPRLTTNAFCNEKGTWDALYQVTSPKPLYIET